MIPTPLLVIGIFLVACALFYGVRRAARYGHPAKTFDLGAVSTRWLSELRRDEPWTR